MADMKNSYEQRGWEYAVGSHARGKRMLALVADKPQLASHADYWRKHMRNLEKEYPQLRRDN